MFDKHHKKENPTFTGITRGVGGFGFGAGSAESTVPSIAVVFNDSPYIHVYPWITGVGFGAKYSDPSTLPGGDGLDVTFSPDGSDIAVAHDGSPYITVYSWSSSGFGAKYSDPSTSPGYKCGGVAFSPDGSTLAVAQLSGFAGTRIYSWSSSGFGTLYSNPSNIERRQHNITFSPDGSNIAVVGYEAPYVQVFPWSSSGAGTLYSAPSFSTQLGRARGVAFSPDGSALAIAHADGFEISVYRWSSSGFGNRYALPSPLLHDTAMDVAFSPDGSDIAIGTVEDSHASSRTINVYAWSSSGFGTKYSNPATSTNQSPHTVLSVKFSPDGSDLVIGHSGSPYVSAYPWTTGVGFGTKYSDPSTLPTNTVNGVAFSPV